MVCFLVIHFILRVFRYSVQATSKGYRCAEKHFLVLTICSKADYSYIKRLAFRGYLQAPVNGRVIDATSSRHTIAAILSQIYSRAQSRSLTSRPSRVSPIDWPTSTMKTVASLVVILVLPIQITENSGSVI